MRSCAFLFFLLVAAALFAVQAQQSLTTASGLETVFTADWEPATDFSQTQSSSRDDRVSIRWQTSDPVAIAGLAKVSGVLQSSFIQWHLNNERVSLFYDNNVPLWEHTVSNLDFGYPIDMQGDGTVLAAGDGTLIKIFDPNSSTPVWEKNVGRTIGGLVLSPAGDLVYVAFYDSNQDLSYIECYAIGNSTALWNVTFPGGVSTLGISGDGSTLVFTQYGGTNSHMWVLAAEDGNIIFQGPEYNQNPPAISPDASLIVNGDYSGYVHVYQYVEALATYEELWSYHVGGGGTSAWIGGMAISEDCSTIAVGTLVFLTGGYDGEIYLFNTMSPTPLWVYENAGDYVISIDMNYDGSLIAAGGWGPLNHSTADFFLFRRESNIPVFEINTPGSILSVDMAEDGSFCTLVGKAVHCREMGSGGLVYAVDCDLGGGTIIGNIDLENSEDNSGVKVEVSDLTDYYTYTDYEGNFTLLHVPSDIYWLSYTKIGYFPNGSFNVVVLDGEITDVGTVVMTACGVPPQNLLASQASGLTVDLSWQAPAGTVEGYNIYRKSIYADPYPEEPLASVAAGTTHYSDPEALPLVDYYYVVTAIQPGGFQSPYSNEVTGWISHGFVTDHISVYQGTTPVIDGVISPGEWDDAFRLDTSDFWGTYDNMINPIGSVIGYFKINSTLDELYVAYINYNDTVLEDHDEVALYIDDNGDGVFPPVGDDSEGNYWAVYYASGNQLRYRPIYNTGGVGTVQYLADPQVEVSVAEGYLVYEFMVPLGTETWQIDPNDLYQSTLAIFVLDDPSNFDAWWPLDNINLFNPVGYGTISFGVEPQTPPAPENLVLTELDDYLLNLCWSLPPIDDFDHFNVYLNLNGAGFNVIDETIGTSYYYQVTDTLALYSFYMTTVNQFDMESDASGIVEFSAVGLEDQQIPLHFELSGNYPNPFNPVTTIRFTVGNDNTQPVELTIYNLKGQQIRTLLNEILPAGNYQVDWNGEDNSERPVASGVYLYQLQSGSNTSAKKMLLLK